MKKLATLLAAASLALGCAVSASAFSYQGALADVDGNPLTGTKTVEFRLYANASGGTALWGRACNVTLDEKGIFNTEIDDASGSPLSDVASSALLDDVLAANAANLLYLGLTVAGTSGEIAPRLSLLPVPYAIFAQNVAKASGDFAAAGKVTSAQLAVSGDATFASSATVSGSATVEGNLTVSGTVSGYGSVPVGTIVLWSGNAGNIPDGWALCNGANGTPNLSGRFVVGYDSGDGDYNSPGKTGGEKRHTLSVAEMPSHTHDNSVKTVGYSGAYNGSSEAATHDSHDRNNGWKTIKSDSAGGGQSHENRPPYYVLCYIMRVK